jgi:hypothetical protein
MMNKSTGDSQGISSTEDYAFAINEMALAAHRQAESTNINGKQDDKTLVMARAGGKHRAG